MGRLALCALAVFLTGCAGPLPAGEMEWMRRGTVHVRVAQPCALEMTFRDGAAREGYLYVFGPDGDAVAREPIAPGARTVAVALDAGPGDYRVVYTADSAWRAQCAAPIVFEPELEWTSLHQRDDAPRRYWFSVPEGTQRLSLTATNQNGSRGAPALVSLHAPGGAEVARLQFERLDPQSLMAALGITSQREAERSYRVLTQSHEVTAPEPGMWWVEAACIGYADDIGFWLDGVPNLVAATPAEWFEPRFPPAQARVQVDATDVIGPTGTPSVIASFNRRPERVLEVLDDLGMAAITDYTGQDLREPTNDDDDPAHFNWEGFSFGPADERAAWIPRANVTTLTHIYGAAPDWLGPVGGDVWMANLPEVAEFVAAWIYHFRVQQQIDMRYFTFINEPNLNPFFGAEGGVQRYIDSYLAVGERVKALDNPAMADARLGGPDITLGGDGLARWEWIAELLDAADDYVDFVSYDVYAYPLLDQTWRYADDVRTVQRIIEEHDTDGEREEILIFETNLQGGLYLQHWRQDTHYSAVWWASVLSHALGTGGVRAITYFTLVEQGARRKGLLTEDLRPKPVYHAMRLFNRHLLPTVVRSGASHAQIDCLATTDERGARLSVFVVNRAQRTINLADCTVRLPAGISAPVTLTTWRFAATDATPVTVAEGPAEVNDRLVELAGELPPGSIWLFEWAHGE